MPNGAAGALISILALRRRRTRRQA
jgi:hypothetical protein